MNKDLTIGQIINLHQKLLQNDGVEHERPLRIVLGTRPNFSTRLANLSSGASEGKGLSELVIWDEQSENLEESVEFVGNEHEEESNAENYEAGGVLGDVVKGENAEVHDGSDDNLAHERTTERESPLVAADSHGSNATEIDAANGNHAADSAVAQQTASADASPSQNLQAWPSGGSEYNEDGDDLIDYSEEEGEARQELRNVAKSHPTRLDTDYNRKDNGTFTDFIPPCLKPNTCFCSKCNDLLLAEYEAINEELRRRSTSRTAEENLPEQPTGPSGATEGEDLDHETHFETENGVDYDQNDGEDFGHGNEATEYEDPSADFGEVQPVELDQVREEYFVEDDNIRGSEGSEELEDRGLISESKNEAGGKAFVDEFELGEEGNTEPQKLPTLADRESQSHDNRKDSADDHLAPFSKETLSTGSSLGFADAGDSESAASEKTLEAQPSSIDDPNTELNEEHEDEIDYDDDEEQDVPEAQEPSSKELHIANTRSSKRPRADDDGLRTRINGMYKFWLLQLGNLLMRSTDAKRPRS